MILFLRSSDIGIDSRLRRYCHALRESGFAFAALYWDRDGKAVGDVQIPSYRFCSATGYGNRALTAFNLIKLNLFGLRTLWKLRKTVRLVHAVDLDTAASAWLFYKLTGTPFIYDIYDNYPDSRGVKGLARWPLDWLERRVIKSAALVILADESRTAQHPPIAEDRLLVIENVPDVARPTPPRDMIKPSANQRLKIGYLGTLEARYRGLEDVMAVVEKDQQLELHIGGMGALRRHVRDAAALCTRIHVHGPMTHEAGLAMLGDCDVLLGLYYREVANHRFAAPNKYYEHLLLGKPMLTSAGTPPGDKVVAHDTGWAITDGRTAIAAALTEARTDPGLRVQMGRKARALWQSSYADYFQRVLIGHYVARVASLVHSDEA